MKNRTVLIWLRTLHVGGELPVFTGNDTEQALEAIADVADKINDDDLVFKTLERNLSSAKSWPDVLQTARENNLMACLYFSNIVLLQAGAPQTKNRTMYLALEAILHFRPKNDVVALMCLIDSAFADLEKTGNVSYVEIRQD